MGVWFDFRSRSASGLVSKLFIDQRCNQRQSSIRWSVTHGFVLDERGLKMSRSLGKVVDPLTVTEGGKNQEVGDSDVLIGSQVLQQISRKRGTLRFLLGNLHNWKTENAISYDELPEIDQHALLQLNAL
ncbi:tRNA synthetase class I (I, L, M and V) family protein [Artemisia annua]|uniref:tRNA synthetase class I (I, L, M and V) family protein n=1 Tax=Artemisia annua TaxID=35608 RepID=A0A2U1LKJ7_ARTAN|nr:tRNA synthetase class I (I, L, M and V) family protein [Artemisia annua]